MCVIDDLIAGSSHDVRLASPDYTIDRVPPHLSTHIRRLQFGTRTHLSDLVGISGVPDGVATVQQHAPQYTEVALVH